MSSIIGDAVLVIIFMQYIVALAISFCKVNSHCDFIDENGYCEKCTLQCKYYKEMEDK